MPPSELESSASAVRTCEDCGATLPGDALGGLCPRCLLRTAFGADDDEEFDEGGGDRNLLFAVFAVQMHKVSPVDVMVLAGAWATDPTRSLAARLVESGKLSATDRDFIESLVEKAALAHEKIRRKA